MKRTLLATYGIFLATLVCLTPHVKAWWEDREFSSTIDGNSRHKDDVGSMPIDQAKAEGTWSIGKFRMQDWQNLVGGEEVWMKAEVKVDGDWIRVGHCQIGEITSDGAVLYVDWDENCSAVSITNPSPDNTPVSQAWCDGTFDFDWSGVQWGHDGCIHNYRVKIYTWREIGQQMPPVIVVQDQETGDESAGEHLESPNSEDHHNFYCGGV